MLLTLLQFLINKLLKGAVTQNIFSLKSGPKGCKGLWNNNDLQKLLEKNWRN